MTKSIVVEYDLPAPPAKVWRLITEPALVERWLMPCADLRAEVGVRFTFRAPPMPPHWDGTVACEVLAVVAHELFRYSWCGGGGPGALDSTVTWTLAASASGGTTLRLEHAGFPDDHPGYPHMDRGWRGKGEQLVELVREL